MITKQKMQQVADYIRKNCQADDFTISINNSDEHLTRFAQNGITQHINGSKINLSLEVAFENKTGSSTINNLDELSLKQLISTAESIAKVNQPDPEYVSSEGAKEIPNIDNFAKGTEKLTMEKMVSDINDCVISTKSMGAKLSGFSEKYLNEIYFTTKNGFEGYDKSTSFSHSMTIKKGGIETKVSRSVKNHNNFEMIKLYEKLIGQFDSLQEPIMLKKGKLPIILRPAAVLNWLFYLIWVLDQRSADEGMNPFTDRKGTQMFGEKFSFCSTLNDPMLTASKFDLQGIVSTNTNWITNGVLENMKTNRAYAKMENLKANSVFNISVAGENSTENEMMNMVERGIIVNRFWYIRPIDRKTGEWTGLTRDGVLYFENGKIKHSTTNFRWNEIFHEATKRILALGNSEQLEHYAKVPTLLIKDFNLVDVTTF